jgi:hypothetical protein
MTNEELRKELRSYLELFAELRHEDPEGHPRRTLNHIRHIVGCWEVFEYRLSLEKEAKQRATRGKKSRTVATKSLEPAA